MMLLKKFAGAIMKDIKKCGYQLFYKKYFSYLKKVHIFAVFSILYSCINSYHYIFFTLQNFFIYKIKGKKCDKDCSYEYEVNIKAFKCLIFSGYYIPFSVY